MDILLNHPFLDGSLPFTKTIQRSFWGTAMAMETPKQPYKAMTFLELTNSFAHFDPFRSSEASLQVLVEWWSSDSLRRKSLRDIGEWERSWSAAQKKDQNADMYQGKAMVSCKEAHIL